MISIQIKTNSYFIWWFILLPSFYFQFAKRVIKWIKKSSVVQIVSFLRAASPDSLGTCVTCVCVCSKIIVEKSGNVPSSITVMSNLCFFGPKLFKLKMLQKLFVQIRSRDRIEQSKVISVNWDAAERIVCWGLSGWQRKKKEKRKRPADRPRE